MKVWLNDTLIDTQNNRVGDGEQVIESQAMAVLAYLIANAGQLVTRDMLLAHVWQGKVVTDNSLHRVITLLRKALNDDSAQPSYIQTVHGKGYVLIARVSRPSTPLKVRFGLAVAALGVLAWFGYWVGTKQPSAPLWEWQNTGNETSLVGLEYLPQLSRDGQQLLFVHRPELRRPDSQLLLKTVGGDEHQLVYSFSGKVNGMAWSNDRQQVAMAIQQGERCDIIHLDLSASVPTTESATLFTCVPHRPTQLLWSTDQQTLYALLSRSGQEFSSHLYAYSLTRQTLEQKSPATLENLASFARSPHSDALVMLNVTDDNQSHIWLMDPQGEFQHQASLSKIVTQVLWPSATSPYLLLTHRGFWWLKDNGATEYLRHSDVPGMQSVSISQKKHLVYNSGSSRYTLHRRSLTDGQQTQEYQTSSLSQAAASFSPDGSKVAFLSDRRGKGWELWIEENGQNQRIATEHPLALSTPQWRPNGKGLLLLSQQYQLLYLDLGTGHIRVVTSAQDTVLAGSWASNEDLLLSKHVDGQFELFSQHLEHAEGKRLTENGGYFSQLSQDGQYLYFNKRNQNGLWRRELNSGNTHQVLSEFGADNYSRWQVVGDQLYFRHHTNKGFGLFRYALSPNQTDSLQTLVSGQNLWLFHVAPDASEVIYSKQDMAFADIKSAVLKQIE